MARAWLSAAPTIQVLVAELVPTPSSSLAWPPSGLGMRFQLLPSNCSARVWPPLLSLKSPAAQMLRSVVEPTAQALLEVRSATPVRSLGKPGLALGTTVQLVPFQCSVRVCPLLLPVAVVPTDQASAGEVSVTPASVPPVLP